MTTGLLMAGGRSERMRASFGPVHKALVKVQDRTLLEWNVLALLAAGVDQIVFAISANEPEVEAFVRARGVHLAEEGSVECECLLEIQPLGTIGVAARLQDRGENVLVVNVDNLSALDLSALVAHHRCASAAMTIATHVEPFKIPFGGVVVSEGRVDQYLEKPVHGVHISSGTYVLSNDALGFIPTGRRVDIPELFNILVDRDRVVASFGHESPWIDVNDASAVLRAEQLVRENAGGFDFRTSFQHSPKSDTRRVHQVAASETPA